MEVISLPITTETSVLDEVEEKEQELRQESIDHEQELKRESIDHEQIIIPVGLTKTQPRFIWFWGLAFSLLKKFGKISHNDFWILDKENQSQDVYKRFLHYWRKEEQKKKPSIYLSLFKTLWKDIGLAILYQFLAALFALFPPILLNLTLTFILDPRTPYYYGYIYASSLAVV
jgi:hypothetical protein